jgi:hypothetical protein
MMGDLRILFGYQPYSTRNRDMLASGEPPKLLQVTPRFLKSWAFLQIPKNSGNNLLQLEINPNQNMPRD